MRRICFTLLVALATCSLSLADFEVAPRSETHNPEATICHDPNKPCKDDRFKDYDLAFNLAKKLKWQNAYFSVEFYAVLLKSVKSVPDNGPSGDVECSGFFEEKDRKEAQALFPGKKVFASRFGCFEHAVYYTGTNRDYNFLAVYGGKSRKEAQKTLELAKATGKFGHANLRKMRVGYEFGD